MAREGAARATPAIRCSAGLKAGLLRWPGWLPKCRRLFASIQLVARALRAAGARGPTPPEWLTTRKPGGVGAAPRSPAMRICAALMARGSGY